jgi:aspartokinase-like uncharacterized kinase
MPSLVVKVGGSLYDLPDLATRLRLWLSAQGSANIVLIPGGGPTANAIRGLDAIHKLGEEKAHWLALRALTLNARFLKDLLTDARVVRSLEECGSESPSILDAHAFACWDEETNSGTCLPHSWNVTSDSLAARVAVVAGAQRLCLLKSTAPPENIDWWMPEYNYVDPLFHTVFPGSIQGWQVEIIDFRQ